MSLQIAGLCIGQVFRKVCFPMYLDRLHNETQLWLRGFRDAPKVPLNRSMMLIDIVKHLFERGRTRLVGVTQSELPPTNS